MTDEEQKAWIKANVNSHLVEDAQDLLALQVTLRMADRVKLEFDGDGWLEAISVFFDYGDGALVRKYDWLGEDEGWDHPGPPFAEVVGRLWSACQGALDLVTPKVERIG